MRKKLFNISALMIAILLSGCATAAVDTILPDGSKGLSIACGDVITSDIAIVRSWASCYRSAGKACPQGYDIIDKAHPHENRFLVIKCKNSKSKEPKSEKPKDSG